MTPAERLMQFIVQFKTEHDGNSPSYQEMIVAGVASSTSIARYRLLQLERQGKIRLAPGSTSRMIHVVGGVWLPPE